MTVLMIVGSACSVNLSTDLVPTLPPTTTGAPRVHIGDQVGIPTDSADAEVARLLLAVEAQMEEFVQLSEAEANADYANIGDYVDSSHSITIPLVTEMLTEFDRLGRQLVAYAGRADTSFSDMTLLTFVGALSTWVEGQRFQTTPAGSCLDHLPPSASELPVEMLMAYPDFVDCLTDLASSQLVAKTAQAGADMGPIMTQLIQQIADG